MIIDQKIDVYLAFTPLHLKIANSIPKTKSSILIVLNKKDLTGYIESYVDRDSFAEIKVYCKPKFNLKDLLLLKHEFSNVDKIFVGNYKFINFRLICFFVKYQKLITFDDGIGSITGNYFDVARLSFKEVVYFIFGVSTKQLFKKHQYHLTIYKDKVVRRYKKTMFLPLIEKNTNLPYYGNVLISTDKSEVGTLSIEDELTLFRKIRDKFNIGHVIHHPSKVNNIKLEGINLINLCMLSEDIIINSNFNRVYTLSASVAVGLLNQKGKGKIQITYLANRSSENFQKFRDSKDICTFAFEDL